MGITHGLSSCYENFSELFILFKDAISYYDQKNKTKTKMKWAMCRERCIDVSMNSDFGNFN